MEKKEFLPFRSAMIFIVAILSENPVSVCVIINANLICVAQVFTEFLLTSSSTHKYPESFIHKPYTKHTEIKPVFFIFVCI